MLSRLNQMQSFRVYGEGGEGGGRKLAPRLAHECLKPADGCQEGEEMEMRNRAGMK